MAVAPLLQIRRIVGRRSSEDVSLAFLAVITVGSGCWTAYAMSVSDWFLLIPNSVAWVTNSACLVLAQYFRRRMVRATVKLTSPDV
jgi:MtN3 and saliva related transmembrane protein